MRLWAPLRKRAADLVVCVLLFSGAATAGVFYNRTFIAGGGQPQYYQRDLDAAVMQACGRGFTRVQDLADAPALDAFLRQKRPQLDCSEVPQQIPTETPGILARVSRYLFGGITALWWLRGISWRALDPLFGVLFGASAVAAYALFRIAMNRPVAAGVTIAWLSSSAQFNNLPHLRDYAKAPFIIAIIALAVWIGAATHSLRRLLVLSATAGAVLGIGLGVRTDLVLFLVPIPVAILLSPLRRDGAVREKALALAAFAAAFVPTAWPILRVYAGGNNIWHVILLGLMSAFDEPLGVATPFYTLGHLYMDEYVSMVINSYSARLLGSTEVLPLASKAYEQASFSYFTEVLNTMPADLLIRVYASIVQVLRLPFDSPGGPPDFISGTRIDGLYALRARLLSPVASLMPFLGAAALAVVSAASVRLAIFWVFAVAFFAGMPALQYQQRHFFHLEVAGWLLLGAAVMQVYSWVRASRPHTVRAWLPGPPATRRAIAFVTVLAIAVFGTLAALRAYQRRTINTLVRAILSAPAAPVRTSISDAGWTIVTGRDLSAEAGGEAPKIRTTYLSVLVTPGCPFETVPVIIKYGLPKAALSTTITAPVPDGVETATRMILPVYEVLNGGGYQPATAFERLEIRAYSECVGGVWRIRTSPDMTLLPFLTLDEGWPAADRFQSFRGARPGERLYSDPASSPVPRSLRHAALDPGLTAPSDVWSPARRVSGRWTVRGQAERHYSYLVMGPEEIRRRGTKLVARGSIDDGGFTLGFLSRGRWASRVDVSTPGRFRIVLDVPEDGAYQILLANYLQSSLHTSFVIDEIGWAADPLKQIATAR